MTRPLDIPEPASAWTDACLAARLLALDTEGLGGAALRGSPGPARDAWLNLLLRGLPSGAPVRRLPAGLQDERMLGGLDLPASLSLGRPVVRPGILVEADGGLVVLPSAERLSSPTAARVAAGLDDGEVRVEREGFSLRAPARFILAALDESRDDEDPMPMVLLDRLAFHLRLEDRESRASGAGKIADLTPARTRLALLKRAPARGTNTDILEGLCAAALAWGVDSPRATLFAMRAARAHAALRGAKRIAPEDAVVAARLVIAPRARRLPDEDAPSAPPLNEPGKAPSGDETPRAQLETPSELLVEAVRAALPEAVLAAMSQEQGWGAAASARSRGRRNEAPRGTPIGSRAGRLRPGARLDIPGTLRAAAPWQTVRGGGLQSGGRLLVRPDDFRLRRFTRDPEATTIIAVDASGSTAIHRLAEAKGAVEILLARAYVDRSCVALIAFRGLGAEVLLPPTRSLSRAKRRLASLPGGGGTPLAAGLEAARALAMTERARQKRSRLVLVTDGRANIALDGTPGRARAVEDALTVCRQVGAAGIEAIYIDAAPRVAPDGDRFAKAMGARYAPLPFLRAGAVADLITTPSSPARGR